METSRAPAPTRAYRARRPERTVLHRALAHYFERFLSVYEERFQPSHGYLRRCVVPAVYRYLNCGVFDQGVARVRCPDCWHDFLVALSSKLRGLCPSCHQKRELLNFHPHVHILVTDGGFGPDRDLHQLSRFNLRHLESLFRAEVLRILLDQGLSGQETVRNLLTWRHSGFSVHSAVRVEARLGAARLGRYMIRCPLAFKRLSWDEDTA